MEVVLRVTPIVVFLWFLYRSIDAERKGPRDVGLFIVSVFAVLSGTQAVEAVVFDEYINQAGVESSAIVLSKTRLGTGNLLPGAFLDHDYSNSDDVFEQLARWVVTGSHDRYRVDCRVTGPNGRAFGYSGFVDPKTWDAVHVGETLPARSVDRRFAGTRLTIEHRQAIALVHLGWVGLLLFACAIASGRLRWTAPRREYIETTGVVIAVEPVQYVEAVRWRVRFKYTDPLGIDLEAEDEFIRKPAVGAVGRVRYDPDEPRAATLDLSEDGAHLDAVETPPVPQS